MKRRLAAVLAGLAVVVPVLALAPAHADQVPLRVSASDGVPFTATKQVTRTTWLPSSGGWSPYTTQRTVTVDVDHTANLRGRERVAISWRDAMPSGARAANPYGERGLNQEYPVVILQCRGTAATVTPQTCWTSTWFQRSQVAVDPSAAIWTRDPAGSGDRLQGETPFPDDATCPGSDVAGYDTHLTPFVAANGKVYAACNSKQMPPEAAVDSAYPPSEIAAYSDAEGNGSALFEVRSDVENESLGCNHDTPCTIEVIPIMGTGCAIPTSAPDPVDFACKKAGQFAPGSSNFADLGVDPAVSPRFWWTAANWANRITVPLHFALPPDTCDVLDPRPPTGFYGSELLSQAALQWAPAYCLNKSRFKFQHNVLSDAAGFMLMQHGDAPAAEVSGPHDAGGGDPVAYAPTALTGFGIGYVIDKPDNGGAFHSLRLDARLLAKLLTASYPGSAYGAGHPGLADNPWSLNLDPEFKALNPGLSDIAQEAGSTILSLSESSDVMTQLTSYIKSDPEAMAFIHGKPDPWGMRINPAYRDISLPQAQWPMLDDYVPAATDPCHKANPAVYLNLIAAPVTKLLTIAQALIDGWPNVQTRCEPVLGTNPPVYKTGRVDRQSYGARFMLGVVSLGDAARYGLDVASLQTRPGNFVGPTVSAEQRAVGLMTQPDALGPFVLDQREVRRDGSAYPGTMVIYTAARTHNLDQADADKVTQFIHVSTTEGQVPGSGNGRLPGGFVPIRNAGATAALFRAAQQAAKAITAQAAPPTPAPSGPPAAGSPPPAPGGSTVPPAAPGPVAVPPAPPATDTPTGTRTEVAAAPHAALVPVVTARTQLVSSGTGRTMLPMLIVLALIGLVTTAVSRLLNAGGRRS